MWSHWTRLSGLPSLEAIFLDLDENVRQRPTRASTSLTDFVSKDRYLQELRVFIANYGMCGALSAVKGANGVSVNPVNILAETVLTQYDQSGLLFPPEWVRAALVLALISIWVVIGLFVYLNRTTKESYFNLWTVAWMFYSVYLAAAIGLEETPDTPFLVMVRRACIGISALFMFWGSFQLTGHSRNRWELGSATILMLLWSCVAAYKVQARLWITTPVFVLLSAAGIYTGILYMRHRKRHHGANILAVGFLLWGVHLLAFPFVERSPALLAGGYLTSAALSLLITVGMVVEHQFTLSEQNYRELFDSAGDAMFLVDYETLRILEANPSAHRLAGHENAKLIGRSILDLFPELREGTGRGQDGQTAGHMEYNPLRELRLPRPDGQYLVYEATANMIFGPQGPVLLIDARDITERKRATEALRETARQLEQALIDLRATQQQVVQQERLRALEKMASGVAHDFNNALARILGFNELLLTGPENLKDPEKVKKYLQMMNAAALDAVKIVNRLREFYRHRKDTEVYKPVDLFQVIEQAVVLTQPKWKDQVMASGATVRIETDLQDVSFVRGSSTDLREVLVNLIFNAVDAMPDGGTLTIATRADNAHVILEVRDTGTGMTEEVRQRCFEPFFSTKKETGTGLGLAIVYGIVQRHGGEIAIQSEVGKGTTVSVRLPVPAEQQAEDAPTHTAARSPLNVLLVEDDPYIRDIEAEYLRGDGHAVATATNGKEGLAKFRASHFDLVLADRAMPEMNGDQMTEAIKSLIPGMPVIMVTGFADLFKSDREKSRGPDLVLSKPITQETLREAIVTVTTRSEIRR